MRLVNWTDENGYKRRSLVRDNDPDTEAESGIRKDIPSLNELDWEDMKRTLHNYLFDNGVFTRDDVTRLQNSVTNAITATFRRQIINLYRRQE